MLRKLTSETLAIVCVFVSPGLAPYQAWGALNRAPAGHNLGRARSTATSAPAAAPLPIPLVPVLTENRSPLPIGGGQNAVPTQAALDSTAEALAGAKDDDAQEQEIESLYTKKRPNSSSLDSISTSAKLAPADNSASGVTPAPLSASAAAPQQQGGAAPPAPPAPPGGGGYTPQQVKRALLGLTLQRLFSLVAASISSIAYPLMVIEAAGKAESYTLAAMGGLISIVLSLAAGKVGDMMPLKKYALGNFALRSVLSATSALFYQMGWMGFGPLLVLNVFSAWQFASLFINENAIQTEIVGSSTENIRSTEALIRMTTIAVTVVSGFFIGPALIAALGFGWTYALVAAIQAVPVLILWLTLPSGGRMSRVKFPAWSSIKEQARAWWARIKAKPWKPALTALALAGALALFFFPLSFAPFLHQSPIPLIAVGAVLLLRSEAYRSIIKPNLMLKASLLFVMIGAFAEIPLRNNVLGVLSKETTGSPGAAAAYLGSMVAAFYLGQAPSGTGMLDPKLTVFGFSVRKAFKWIGAAGLAAWVYFVLIPNPLIMIPAAALYVALHELAPKISDQAWMRLESAALLFMVLPLFFWGQAWALYVALAVFGFVLNGSQRMLSATFTSLAKKTAGDKFQYLSGMRSSFMTMATAYSLYGLAKETPELWGEKNAFPFTWYVVAGTYAVFALLFWRGAAKFGSPLWPRFAYFAKRKALVLLYALFGQLHSLPAVSRAMDADLVRQAASKKAFFMDFDDTSGEHNGKLQPSMVEAVRAARKAGKKLIWITERPAESIFASLDPIPAQERHGIHVSASAGAEIYHYSAQGQPEKINQEPGFSTIEAVAIRAAAKTVKAKLPALKAKLHEENFGDYSYAMLLAVGTPEKALRAVSKEWRTQLKIEWRKNKIPGKPYVALAFTANDPAKPPYVRFRKVDKSSPVLWLAQRLPLQPGEAVALGDKMYEPRMSWGFGWRWVKRLGEWLGGRPLPSLASDTDRDMERGLPGMLALSVGETADPTMSNGYVLRGKGPELTEKILRAAGVASGEKK